MRIRLISRSCVLIGRHPDSSQTYPINPTVNSLYETRDWAETVFRESARDIQKHVREDAGVRGNLIQMKKDAISIYIYSSEIRIHKEWMETIECFTSHALTYKGLMFPPKKGQVEDVIHQYGIWPRISQCMRKSLFLVFTVSSDANKATAF